jgi:hypothetical protein
MRFSCQKPQRTLKKHSFLKTHPASIEKQSAENTHRMPA